MTADAVEAKIIQDVKLDRGPVVSNTDGALYKKSLMKVSKPKGLCSRFGFRDVETNEWLVYAHLLSQADGLYYPRGL